MKKVVLSLAFVAMLSVSFTSCKKTESESVETETTMENDAVDTEEPMMNEADTTAVDVDTTTTTTTETTVVE